MKRVSLPAFFLIVGIAIGGGSVKLYDNESDIHSRELFEQRDRCKSLADKYATEQSAGNQQAVSLRMVDFSMVSNSCVGAFDMYESDERTWELVDLLTGKETYIGYCSENKNLWRRQRCGAGF